MPLLCHWEHFSFTPYSVLSGKTRNNGMKMWFLKPTLYNRTCTSSERAFHRQDKGTRRWGYQNWIRYPTVSYEAEEMWSPMVHTPNHCAQGLKWAEWKIMCIHALEHSNVVQNSQHGATSKASICGLPHFKHKHHENKLLKKLRLWQLNWQRRVAVVKQTKKYAKPMAENNADLSDRFSLLCNSDLFI